MPPAKEPDTETQSDFDIDSAQAEISSDLFGQDEDGEDGEPAAGEEGAESGQTVDSDLPPQPDEAKPVEGEVLEDENSAAVRDVGAPKTWTKEALETWATIPPRAQQEILKREEDFFKGISQYKGAAEVGAAYDAVIEPYKPILAAEQIDPVQMFQSFAANHYILTKGSPEQKIELAAAMLAGYQIPLPELLNYIADQDLDFNPPDPEVTALRNELGQIKNLIAGAQSQQAQQVSNTVVSEINAFAADPAHPHFDELAADIGKLFEAGLATSLQEAYEKAVYANPQTRQKEIDRLTAEARTSAGEAQKTRKDKIARLTADQVLTTPKSRDGTVPVGSIDDTLAETMASIESRG